MGKYCFRVNCRHAEEGDDPHPEDCAGASGQDCAGCADYVAGTYLRCDGGREGLERTHALFVFFAIEGEVSEDTPHAFSETADLNESGLEAVPETHKQQKEDQDIVRQIGIDCLYDGQQHLISTSCSVMLCCT